MKIHTIGPIPDDVWRAARIKAAQENTSLAALVRNYLVELVSSAGGLDYTESSLDRIPPDRDS
jgi:plasmid stability protein